MLSMSCSHRHWLIDPRQIVGRGEPLDRHRLLLQEIEAARTQKVENRHARQREIHDFRAAHGGEVAPEVLPIERLVDSASAKHSVAWTKNISLRGTTFQPDQRRKRPRAGRLLDFRWKEIFLAGPVGAAKPILAFANQVDGLAPKP